MFLFLVQLGTILGFSFVPQSPFWQGLASGILFSPYWTARHIAMVQNTSKENRGYEVSISIFLSLIASLSSISFSAYMLETHQQHTGLIVALVTMMLGTLFFMLTSRIKRQSSVKTYLKRSRLLLKKNPYISRRIISQGFYETSYMTLVGLMYLMGIAPTFMATIVGMNMVLMFFLSPLVGKICHSLRKHAYNAGLIIMGAAWLILPLLSPVSLHGSFLLFMACFAMGYRIMDSSLDTGLYEMQSYAAMMWSEVFYGIGRFAGLIILVPLLYYNRNIYFGVMVLAAFILLGLNKLWQRQFGTEKAM